jgi:hypothetical protein
MSDRNERSVSRNDLIRKVKELCRQHEHQRVQLELALETTPRDSRYSTQLVDLMKREEVLQCEAAASPALIRDLTSKVDRALADETQKYFTKVSNQNIRKWSNLQGKQTRESDRLRSQMGAEVISVTNSSVQPSANATKKDPVEVTPADLDLEAIRLEEEYNRNWMQHEGFHLSEAFQKQVMRVERDWGTHETTLRDEFKAKRKQILGYDDGYYDTRSRAIVGNDQVRWHDPEKQKTLIHTAPVFAPSAVRFGNSTGAGGGAGRGTKKSREDAQLEQLDKQLAMALEGHQRQKEAALRWMKRQQIRIMAQAEAVRAEREAIGDIIAEDRAKLWSVMSAYAERRTLL